MIPQKKGYNENVEDVMQVMEEEKYIQSRKGKYRRKNTNRKTKNKFQQIEEKKARKNREAAINMARNIRKEEKYGTVNSQFIQREQQKQSLREGSFSPSKKNKSQKLQDSYKNNVTVVLEGGEKRLETKSEQEKLSQIDRIKSIQSGDNIEETNYSGRSTKKNKKTTHNTTPEEQKTTPEKDIPVQ